MGVLTNEVNQKCYVDRWVRVASFEVGPLLVEEKCQSCGQWGRDNGLGRTWGPAGLLHRNGMMCGSET